MDEVRAIRDATNPAETLLVVDAMTGQDAVNTARAFNEALGVTGIVMTRMDGDARGGAALSMRQVTGAPIKLTGSGEKLDALEEFHPERVAGRILGMGDIVGLVEKRRRDHRRRRTPSAWPRRWRAARSTSRTTPASSSRSPRWAACPGILGMLPGVGKIKDQLEDANLDTGMLKRQGAIIGSMTKARAQDPRHDQGQPQEAHRRRAPAPRSRRSTACSSSSTTCPP